jgi:hypothetical protein
MQFALSLRRITPKNQLLNLIGLRTQNKKLRTSLKQKIAQKSEDMAFSQDISFLDDITKPFVGYFDSYGYVVPPLIARLMRSFKLQINTCELGTNARRFQFGGSQCGMFSMYFIICMMYGIMFKDFCKDSVNDQVMADLRKILFSK